MIWEVTFEKSAMKLTNRQEGRKEGQKGVSKDGRKGKRGRLGERDTTICCELTCIASTSFSSTDAKKYSLHLDLVTLQSLGILSTVAFKFICQ